MNIFIASETWPFGTALLVLVGLCVVEGLGLLFSQSPLAILDALIPEIPDDIGGPLGWLHVGKVPLLVLLILFLTGFSVSGYTIQGMSHALIGIFLPVWLATLPALLAGFSVASGLGTLLAKIVPKDESTAVSELSLIGRAGVIVRGIATNELAAEAKVRDIYGHVHYVMVQPDIDEEIFNEGSAVLLVKKVGAKFHCIRNPHPELLSV